MNEISILLLMVTIQLNTPSNHIKETIIAFLILGSLLLCLIKPKKYN